ncbi:MAG TPA: periplasmic heavy metal sensor [Terracidiphilus sp.]|nr:periplasmic heavy metal sensor [Terracidiphilus sp.]
MKTLGNSIVGLALAIALAGAVAASAQPDHGVGPGFEAHRGPMEKLLGPGGPSGRWWNNPNVIEKMKLTDDQRKEMDQILLQHREDLIDMRAGVDKAELGLEPLLGADQPNEPAILAQIDRIAQARAELEKANARFLLAIRAKLSPDQFKELKAWRDERGGQMMRWRNRRGPGAPGGPQGGPDSRPGPQDGPAPASPPSGPDDPQSLLLPQPGPNPAPDSLPGTIE